MQDETQLNEVEQSLENLVEKAQVFANWTERKEGQYILELDEKEGEIFAEVMTSFAEEIQKLESKGIPVEFNVRGAIQTKIVLEVGE